MFYYFYFELSKIFLNLFSTINYNFYYKLTYFLNSFLENIYLNLVLFSLIFPVSIFSYIIFELNLYFVQIENNFNLTSLIIGYYNIHPILLYLSIFFFFNIYKYNNFFFIYTFKFFFYLITCTLLLGGFWGAGNGVWGYFWVNDIIEQILLFLVLGSLVLVHFYLSKSSIILFYIYLIFNLLTLLLLRIGIFNTRHSFFDITNLNNIYFYWNINNYLISIDFIKLVIILFFKWFFFFLIIIIFSFLLIQLSFSSLSITLLHIIIYNLIYIWLKYSQHNLSWKTLLFSQNFININLYINTQNLNNIFIEQKNYLIIFMSNTNWFFFKKQISIFFIYFKYITIIFLFFFILF